MSAARKAGRASASALSADPVVDRYQVQAQMELELREAGPAAVRALRLRSPNAAGALEGYLAAHAAAQGKRPASTTEGT